MRTKIIPVILCGGSGTRLWPASRGDMPKQFLSLLGTEQSLLQMTAQRAINMEAVDAGDIVTICLSSMLAETCRHLADIHPGLLRNVVGEPEPRNTAAAITLAACYVRENYGADALMLILPSDHHIGNEAAFARAVDKAAAAAIKGRLVLLGIRPTRPETGYGYIAPETGANENGIYGIRHFREKPDAAAAETYCNSGDYLWNSGIYIASPAVILGETALHAPQTAHLVSRAFAEGRNGHRPSPHAYADIRKEPFEKAVIEKSERTAVVPCQIGWSDIGSWKSLWEVGEKDENGNVRMGTSIFAEDAEGCLVKTESRIVACVGVKDLVIVECGDTILIAGKDSSEKIKTVAAAIEGTLHDWGASKIVSSNPGCEVHETIIAAGKSRSMRLHTHTGETWNIVSGTGTFTIGGKRRAVGPRDTIAIPPHAAHSLSSNGAADLRLYEFHYSEADELPLERAA